MKADSYKIFTVLGSGGAVHYALPHFQREYAWERDQWQTLLDDVVAIHEEVMAQEEAGQTAQNIEHFLGSLVVVNTGTVSGTIPAFKLVDGQQRLTTVSLLLCALACVVGETDAQLAEQIKSLLLNQYTQGDYVFKVLPTTKYGDRAAYKAILQGKAPPESDSRIPAAFQYFRQQLTAKLANGELQAKRLYLTLANSLQVVRIELHPDENPYKIFESLNAKGKPLEPADLVRNYIAMTLPVGDQEDVFCSHWAPMEGLLQEKRTVGKSGLGELTAFLRHYLAMRHRVLFSEKHVYARFRDRMNREFATPATFAQEIAVLHEYAVLYDALLRPERQPDPHIGKAIERLRIFDISTAYPFLLSLSHAHRAGEITSAEFADALRLIENYLMRRFLAEEPTNYLNKMFPALWAQVATTNLLPSLQTALTERRYPNDLRIRQRLSPRPLYQSKGTTQAQIVFLLEQVNRRLSSGTGGVTILDDKATIEHILPQSPGSEWQASLGEEFERYQDFLHTLGNLTLVTQEWNSHLSNSAFVVKKKKLADHALKLNAEYFTLDIPVWNEAAIAARSSHLIDHILAIWPYLNDGGDALPDTPNETANFHPQVAQAVGKHLGIGLQKRSVKQYSDSDDATRVLCSVASERQEVGYKRYWFAITKPNHEYLAESQQGYVAFGCGSADKTILLPLYEFTQFAAKMGVTDNENRYYWHVVLFEQDGHFSLGQPWFETRIDVASYLLPLS